MMQSSLLHLQNGSDVRGVACEGVAGEPVTLTPAVCCRIGYAFATDMATKLGKDCSALRIAVGRDSRITGESLANAFMQGVRLAGALPLDCSLATTPAMFMALIYPETNCDASCMVTASHLPFNRNGLKFFTKEGGFEKSDVTSLLTAAAQVSDEIVSSLEHLSDAASLTAAHTSETDLAVSVDQSICHSTTSLSDKCPAFSTAYETPECFDLLSLYAEKLCHIIRKGVSDSSEATLSKSSSKSFTAGTDNLSMPDSVTADFQDKPLAGLHIVVDAGNGNGGFFATKVLEPLGADISGSQFLEPDGHFPNHIPNPENKEAMASICEATVKAGADLGLIFDTDVDRMSAVFANGQPVNRDACIALAAAILAPAHKGATIVTDSVTSDRLTRFLEDDLGLKHLCYKRGYKNVINKCKELNAEQIDCPLAMETSGHGCLKENYYLDDGAYLAVRFVIALAKAKAASSAESVSALTSSHSDTVTPLQPTVSVTDVQAIASGNIHKNLQGTLALDEPTSDHPAISSARRDPFAGLLSGFSREAADREVRFSISEKDFAAYGEKVLDAFRKQAMKKAYTLPHSYEGVRISFAQGSLAHDFGGGWLLLRASLHDPVMVLNMEGRTASDLETLTNTVRELLREFAELDISAL